MEGEGGRWEAVAIKTGADYKWPCRKIPDRLSGKVEYERTNEGSSLFSSRIYRLQIEGDRVLSLPRRQPQLKIMPPPIGASRLEVYFASSDRIDRFHVRLETPRWPTQQQEQVENALDRLNPDREMLSRGRENLAESCKVRYQVHSNISDPWSMDCRKICKSASMYSETVTYWLYIDNYRKVFAVRCEQNCVGTAAPPLGRWDYPNRMAPIRRFWRVHSCNCDDDDDDVSFSSSLSPTTFLASESILNTNFFVASRYMMYDGGFTSSFLVREKRHTGGLEFRVYKA